MTITQSEWAKGRNNVRYPNDAGSICSARCFVTIPAAMAVGDIIELACLPGGHELVDCVLDSDDLDVNASPTVTFDVGLMSGDWMSDDQGRTCGNELFASTNIGQAGGVARPTKKEACRIAASGKDRSIGLKMTADSATVAAGVIGLRLFYAAG